MQKGGHVNSFEDVSRALQLTKWRYGGGTALGKPRPLKDSPEPLTNYKDVSKIVSISSFKAKIKQLYIITNFPKFSKKYIPNATFVNNFRKRLRVYSQESGLRRLDPMNIIVSRLEMYI